MSDGNWQDRHGDRWFKPAMSEGKQETRIDWITWLDDNLANEEDAVFERRAELMQKAFDGYARQANQPQFDPLVHEVCCHCGHSCQPQGKAQPDGGEMGQDNVTCISEIEQAAFQRGQQAMAHQIVFMLQGMQTDAINLVDRGNIIDRVRIEAQGSGKPLPSFSDYIAKQRREAQQAMAEKVAQFCESNDWPPEIEREWQLTQEPMEIFLAKKIRSLASAAPPQGEAEKEGRT